MNLLAEMARAVAAVTADDMDNPDVSAVDFDRVRAALSAALKHGFKLVPVEPDEAMVKGALSRCKLALGANVAREMLKTALSAAPSIEGDG